MAIGRNLLAGLANSGWTALVGLAAIPYYLKYLGVEAYGLIGFYVTFQAFLQLLDMGMAPTINREVARCSAAGNIGDAGKLLHSLAVVYWCMAAAVAVLVLLLAPLIGTYWLQSRQIAPVTITHAVMLMGFLLACRWPIGLYQGALLGAQRVTISSAINIVMVTIGSVGAIGVLACVSPTIEAFFIWQAGVGLVYAVSIRAAAWRIVGRQVAASFDLASVRRVIRFSLGVGVISLSGLVLTQLDKVILSKTLELDSFGAYMLATTVASGIYILIMPIFNVMYPRFSSLVGQKKYDELLLQYRLSSRLLAALLFPLAMTLILLAQPLVTLWTGSQQLSAEVAPLASLLVFAYALHGVMHMPYALMLAQGEPRPMFLIYVVLIVIMVPLTAVLSVLYGAAGGALAQLSQFVFYLFVGAFVTHKHHLKGLATTWLLEDVGVSLMISILVGFFGMFAIVLLRLELFKELLVGLFCGSCATLLSVFSSKRLRVMIFEFWNKFKGRGLNV